MQRKNSSFRKQNILSRKRIIKI